MPIIGELRDCAPSQIKFDAVTAPEGRHALYDESSKGFLEAQMGVNTVVYLSIEFTIAGEVEKGKKAGRAKGVTDLFSNFSLG